jgi:hypothetical protein
VPPQRPCVCGCGDLASPGKRFISGHNNRGQKRSEATRAKLREGKLGEGNPHYGKLGPASASWKGGVLEHADGYILQYAPDHPFASKRYVMQHRLIAEAALRESDPSSEFLAEVDGERYISPKADVHHDNEVKTDNRVENLIVMWKGDHTRHHVQALIAARWPNRQTRIVRSVCQHPACDGKWPPKVIFAAEPVEFCGEHELAA